MWFKQIQLFQLPEGMHYSPEILVEKLEQLTFKPCLPSLPSGMGWAELLDEEGAPLIRTINHCTVFCLQIEEKILPSSVIRQALDEKVKKLEEEEHRKLRHKEKLSLKDDVTLTLLPRAFSKFTRVYAYLDMQKHWLVLGTLNKTKTEQFLSIFQKTFSETPKQFQLKKISSVMTHWLREKSYPASFAIEKACLLQDPSQQTRTIRCQQQNLFSSPIQSLIKENCEVKQLALSWQDKVNFVLSDDFSLSSIQFQDEMREQIQEMEPETKQQQFDANFVILSGTLSLLLKDLLELVVQDEKADRVKEPVVV